MKKVLSIILTTMMLVSLFAVNASALITTTYTDYVGREVYLEQDFSNAEKLDFTAGVYGSTTVEDECVTLHTPSSSVMHVSSPTPIPADTTQWTLEFDVRRNSDFADTSYYGVIFTCNKSAYKGDEEKIANYIENYGIYIPLMKNEKDVWYTYQISFNEDAVVEQVPNVTSNIPNTLADYLVTSAKYKKAGDTSWTTINAKKGWNSVQGQARSLVRNQGNGYAFKGYPIEVDGEKVNTTNEMSFVFRSPHSSYCATEEETAAANFSLDNIRTMIPGVETELTKPLSTGTVYLAKATANVPAATSYTGSNLNKTNVFSTEFPTPATGERRLYNITFDAKNTVQGMPIMIHIGGATKCNGLTICPTDIIGTDWHSYKISFYEENGVLNFMQALRKPMGSDADYEIIPIDGKYEYPAKGGQLWSYGTPSGGKNDIRIFYYPAVESASKADTVLTETVWEINNLQVTDGAVVTGFANAENDTISVDADFITNTIEASVALAVYDSTGRMKDIDFIKAADGEGTLDLTADYESGDNAALLIWNAADNVPQLRTIDVDAAL